MKRFTELLSGTAAMLFQLSVTVWMFSLSKINFDFEYMSLNYLALAAVLIAAYLADRFMFSKGVPVPLFALLQAGLLALAVWVFVSGVQLEPFVTRTVVINCIIYCIGIVAAVYAAWMPLTQNGILLRFDVLIIMSVLLLVLDGTIGLPAIGEALTVCLLSLLFCLAAAVSLRSGSLAGRGRTVEGSPALGRIMLIAVLGAIAALAAAVVALAGSGVKSFSELLMSIIRTVLSALKTAFLFLYGLLERFMLWLASFIDDEGYGPLEMENMGGIEGGGVDMAEATIPAWMYYVAIALVLALVLYIVFRMRKLRTVSIKVQRSYVVAARRENGLGAELQKLWAKMKAALSFRLNCLRYRSSAPGLLVLCQKRAPESCRRRADESGEAFLRRLAAEGCESGAEALSELACAVERCFYSPAAERVSRELARAVRKVKYKKDEKPAETAA